MRNLILLALLLAGTLIGVPGRAADVVWSYGDFVQNIQRNRQLDLYPVGVELTNAAGITALDRISIKTGPTGTFTTTNLMAGYCKADFHGLWTNTTRWFLIPATNGVVYARDCILTNGMPATLGAATYFGVSYFNGRTGAVTLAASDVLGALPAVVTNGATVALSGDFSGNLHPLMPTTITVHPGTDVLTVTNSAYGTNAGVDGDFYIYATYVWTNSLYRIGPLQTLWAVSSLDQQTNYYRSKDSDPYVQWPWLVPTWQQMETVQDLQYMGVVTNQPTMTTNSYAGYYLRLDSTGTNLIYSPD